MCIMGWLLSAYKTMDINKVFCYHNFSGNFAENKGEKIMIVSSGYRKNGFDAHGGKLLQKKDIVFTRLHKKNRKFRID